MPQFSTKHKDREKTFRFDSFHGGFNQERVAAFLSRSELSACRNLKYVKKQTDQGESVTLRKRQGTTIISNSALSGAADVKACTYYIAQSQYILATATKIYYLDGSFDPVLIGTIEGVPTFTEFNSLLLVHDGVETKVWDGTDFEILESTHIDELLATGDNTETEFTGTLDHPTIVESGHAQISQALSITFTDTTAKEINDDGVGRLTGNIATSWVKNISNVTNNGGLIRITSNAHGFTDGDEINIQSVVGVTAANSTLANPTWTVVNDETNTFDLTASVFAGSYTSGGTASKNTIIYTTGVYNFKCSGAPDNLTLVEADYQQQDAGEESSAGLIRGRRLYMVGCPDHTSRVYYTAAEDETAIDTSAGGGYVDIDPNDGSELVGAINFQTSMLLAKENSLHRMDDYPGDTGFKIEKLTDNLGCVSQRTFMFEGSVVSFMSNEGWVAMHPSQRYGDIQKGVPLSSAFMTNAAKYANSHAYSAYNPIDKQLWLALAGSSGSYLDYIYVVNLETGGQVSLYKFAFGHSCFVHVNGEFLIGGVDGNLYKLDDTNSVFTDNEVDYSDDTYMRTSFEDWGLVNNWKHNKKISVQMSGNAGVSANLKIYTNENYTAATTIALTIDGVWGPIYDYDELLIYDATMLIGRLNTNIESKKKFNYRSIMLGIEDISGNIGVEIMGIDLKTGLMGDK